MFKPRFGGITYDSNGVPDIDFRYLAILTAWDNKGHSREPIARHIKDLMFAEKDFLTELEDARAVTGEDSPQLTLFGDRHHLHDFYRDKAYVGTMLASKPDPFGRHLLVDGYIKNNTTQIIYAGAKDFFFLGEGYYGSSERKMGEGAEWERSHTPHGVTPRGIGLGTALYSLMALAARDYKHAYGIYSILGNRSDEAEEWWEKAVSRGYADSTYDFYTEEEEREEYNDTVTLSVPEDAWDAFQASDQPILDYPWSDLTSSLDEDYELDDGNTIPLWTLYDTDTNELLSRDKLFYQNRKRRFTRDSAREFEVEVTYRGIVTRQIPASEPHTTLSANTVIKSPFLICGVMSSTHPAAQKYGIVSNKTAQWLRPDPDTVRQARQSGRESTMALYDDEGYLKFTKVKAEFVTRSMHGPSVFLTLVLMDAISRVSEDLAVAYASRPDIAPILAGHKKAAKFLADIEQRKINEAQFPLPGINGLSRAAIRELKSRLGAVAEGDNEFGPPENPYNLPKLSAAAVNAQSKFDF